MSKEQKKSEEVLKEVRELLESNGYDNFFATVSDKNHPKGGCSILSATGKDGLMRKLHSTQEEYIGE